MLGVYFMLIRGKYGTKYGRNSGTLSTFMLHIVKLVVVLHRNNNMLLFALIF